MADAIREHVSIAKNNNNTEDALNKKKKKNQRALAFIVVNDLRFFPRHVRVKTDEIPTRSHHAAFGRDSVVENVHKKPKCYPSRCRGTRLNDLCRRQHHYGIMWSRQRSRRVSKQHRHPRDRPVVMVGEYLVLSDRAGTAKTHGERVERAS